MNGFPQEFLGAGLFAAATAALLPLVRRIPESIEREWDEDLRAHQAARASQPAVTASERFGLSKRDALLIVAAALLLGDLVMRRHGFTLEGAAWSFYFVVMLLLTAINLRHQLLPDVLVLGSLWVGLLFQAGSPHPTDAVYGAAAAYVVPWIVAQAIYLLRGGYPLGKGDMKALAMAGAWFGLGSVVGLMALFLIGTALSAIAVKLLRRPAVGWVASGPGHLFASLALMAGPWLQPWMG